MTDYTDRIRVHIDGKEFSVVGGKFKEMLAAIKQINGRRFVGELKVWQLPGSAEDIQNQLEISGYQLQGGTLVADSSPAAQSGLPRPGGDRIRVKVQEHSLAVIGGSFQELLAAVKDLPGRRFDGDSKIWEIPGDLTIIKNLIETAGFQLEGADKIPLTSASSPELPNFTSTNESPPLFEAPDFFDNEDVPPYEPPVWWDDDNMPPPDLEPPDWLEDEVASHPPDEPVFFDNEPPPPMPRTPRPAPATDATPVSRGSDQIRIRVGGIPLIVSGGSFREMLDVIKKIPGRRFNGADKVWDLSLGKFQSSIELIEHYHLNRYTILRPDGQPLRRTDQ